MALWNMLHVNLHHFDSLQPGVSSPYNLPCHVLLAQLFKRFFCVLTVWVYFDHFFVIFDRVIFVTSFQVTFRQAIPNVRRFRKFFGVHFKDADGAGCITIIKNAVAE